MEDIFLPHEEAKEELDYLLRNVFAGSSLSSKRRRAILAILFEFLPESKSGALLAAKDIAHKLVPEFGDTSDVEVRQAIDTARDLLHRYYEKHTDTRNVISLPVGVGYRLRVDRRNNRLTRPSERFLESDKLDESSLKRALAVAIDALNTHTSAGFRATITGSAELFKQGSTADACSALALAHN